MFLADFDTTVADFQAQLDYISAAGLGPDVVTVQQALDTADAEMHGPVAGTVKITPAAPTTSDIVTADPTRFADPDGDALSYQYQWKVNGVAVAGAAGRTSISPRPDTATPATGSPFTYRRRPAGAREHGRQRQRDDRRRAGSDSGFRCHSPTTPILPAPRLRAVTVRSRRLQARALTGRRRRSS